MTTHRCRDCGVSWEPYMTRGGNCPQCGGGTCRQTCDDVDTKHAKALYASILKGEQLRGSYERFEEFYAQREARLNGLDRLPVVEPRTRRARWAA